VVCGGPPRLLKARGGQKTIEPDPPDQSGRPARSSARLLACIQTDTDTDILYIRITVFGILVGWIPARPTIFN
jgi:hypothetical protein